MKNLKRYLKEGGEALFYAFFSSFFVFFVSSNYLIGGIFLVLSLALSAFSVYFLDKKESAREKERKREEFLTVYFTSVRGGNSPGESFLFASKSVPDSPFTGLDELKDDPSRLGICSAAFVKSLDAKKAFSCSEVLSELQKEKEKREEEERSVRKRGQALLVDLFVPFLFFLLKLFFSKTLFTDPGDVFSLLFALVSLLPLGVYLYASAKGEKKHGNA